jgi:hypothetical protein
VCEANRYPSACFKLKFKEKVVLLTLLHKKKTAEAKFWKNSLLNSRLECGMLYIALDGTLSFPPYQCTTQTYNPIPLDGLKLR